MEHYEPHEALGLSHYRAFAVFLAQKQDGRHTKIPIREPPELVRRELRVGHTSGCRGLSLTMTVLMFCFVRSLESVLLRAILFRVGSMFEALLRILTCRALGVESRSLDERVSDHALAKPRSFLRNNVHEYQEDAPAVDRRWCSRCC